jgi:hypothetical protein
MPIDNLLRELRATPSIFERIRRLFRRSPPPAMSCPRCGYKPSATTILVPAGHCPGCLCPLTPSK